MIEMDRKRLRTPGAVECNEIAATLIYGTFPILLANMGFDALVITNSICIVITNASSRNLARRIGNVLYEGFQVCR